MTGGPVETLVTGLDRVARMEPGERTDAVRDLDRNCPMYRSLRKTVTVARIVAFASGLALCVAVLLLAQRSPIEWVAGFVFAGLFGFGWVVVRLTDSRFDLLLAVLGAYEAERTRDGSAVEDSPGRSGSRTVVAERAALFGENSRSADHGSGGGSASDDPA
ncbi:hypothetical protein SAMN04487904_115107 [Actinopolyspora lacussalsi subsp. righensis]|uniref:Uncharacterized protein n=2 Tax=Actinopolyspora righensis TaxID=995060 RepID=A0A1I7C8N2_9ACTN|nr:hypothetical protein SAMN04487904_115107 [Actinopolyspora righensis]